MLQNAFKEYNANASTANHRPKTVKQLFMSSSPLAVEKAKPLPSFHSQTTSKRSPLATSSINLVRPRPESTYGIEGQHAGFKRGSDGLVKALRGGGFGEDQPNTYANPIIIEDTARRGSVQNASTLLFDENDFDSDVELDVVVPTSTHEATRSNEPRRAIKPFLSPTSPRRAPHIGAAASHADFDHTSHLLARSKKPNRQNEATSSSSQAIPWSSSPPPIQQQPGKAPTVASGRHDDPGKGLLREDPASSPQEAPPKKRRGNLPWETDEAKIKAMVVEDKIRLGRVAAGNQKLKDTSRFRTKVNSAMPWTTTASAVKEQHRKLREESKRTTKDLADGIQSTSARTSASKIGKRLPPTFLSDEQRNVLDLVVEKQKSVFFTGSAGTGKSVLLREIIAGLRRRFSREQDRVAVTASTGLAACNIGGVTLHSFSGIGLGKEAVPELVKKIKKNQKAKNRWLRTKVLIIDEISMVDGDLFDKLEAIARNLRNNGRPFGGIQLIITGDFFQLPPVPDYGKVAKFAFDAQTWNTSIEHTIGLHHVFRQKDPEFAEMLNEMREGRLTQTSIDKFKRMNGELSFEDEMEATELFPTRAEVDNANNNRMKYLSGQVYTFEARDSGSMQDVVARTKLLSNCMAAERIELKKGSQVMLIKNVDEQLVNGSLGKVIAFMTEDGFDSYVRTAKGADPENEAQVRAENATTTGGTMFGKPPAPVSTAFPLVAFKLPDGTFRELLCTREQWKTELPNGEVQAMRVQIPLILAWALSIHKAQGQTLERVKVNLSKVFEKGQAYVALSRATSVQGLQVLNFDPRKVVAHDKVRSFYAGLSKAEEHLRKKPARPVGRGKSGDLDIEDDTYEYDEFEGM